MEPQVGNPTAALSERAASRPEAYEFFQLVRLLEQSSPGAPIGHDHPPGDEALALTTHPSLSFPPTAVRSARKSAPGGPLELAMTFLGLVGPLGTLPQPYTELVLQRLYQRDSGLRDFLDVLHHRGASLFYRAWQKYRLPFSFEHERHNRGRHDACTRALLALVGLGSPLLADSAHAPALSWVFYGGHFAGRTRSANDLESLLESATGAHVRIAEFVGQWIPLAGASRTRLGVGGRDSMHNRLGSEAILGDRVWDVQSKVRIHVGPVDLELFRSLRPGGVALGPVTALVRDFLGPSVDFDFEIALDPKSVPPLRLGGSRAAELGRTSWLAAESHRPEDLRVRIGARAR